jgi:hypothetical protein
VPRPPNHPHNYFAQQSDFSTQQAGWVSAAGFAFAAALQQVHSQPSQVHAPVVQQPQQSQAVLHAQELLAPETVATASAPVVTKARTDPTRNLNMTSTPKRKQ